MTDIVERLRKHMDVSVKEAADENVRLSEPRYWLCCGSLDPQHKDKRAKTCLEAKIGHPEHCRFGTAADHSAWQRSTANS